jgi:flagellar biosynthesis protein FlhG
MGDFTTANSISSLAAARTGEPAGCPLAGPAGRRTYEALARASQTFLGFRPPLAGIILRDLKVRESIRQQKTIISVDPQAQAALDAAQIAEALIRGGAEGIEAKSA